MFFPKKKLYSTPLDFNLKYDDVNISLDNGNNIYGWYIYASKPTSKTIIYLHGSKGNLSTYLSEVAKIHEVGTNILVFDYRGFGKSQGMETIKHSIEDALTMYDYLIRTKNIKPEDITLFGFSFGGAVALELALKRPVSSIILESTFSDLCRISIRKCSCIVAPLVSKRLLESDKNIKRINVPIIISYAGKDQVIPITHSKKLFDNANSPKYLYEIVGAEHQNISEHLTAEYISLIKNVVVDGKVVDKNSFDNLVSN
ncbi:MAG: alpha/beta fold hydrolase [Candidatus Melainabacteria bacterium]|nr:alpha/beta fold hydrolase [Candidatus Melainabacteria bacterium]